MKMISPGMYNEMDHLIDKRGRVTDIYIRFILPEESSMLLNGASFFQASDMDEDASQSRFGQFTVSIDVLICETALNLLAHEFGHVKYIVPNLATYRQYYRHTYNLSTMAHRLGHSGSDASGRMSSVFGSQFLRDRRTFRITFGEPPRHVATLIREVNRNAREEVVGMFDDPIASSDSFE
jgi:hypothetical protein